jgi:fatty-acyl-CoA synthase
LLAGPPLPASPAPNLSDALLALEGAGDAPILTFHSGPRSESLTGPELVDLAKRWCGALQARGVGPGDRVVVLFPNDARFVGAFFGALMCGAAAVPVAWPFTMANPARVAQTARPLVEAADPRVIATATEVAGAGWPVPVVSEPGSAGRPVTPYPEDPAFLQFTSGSLGRPRGAVISHRAALASALAMGVSLRATKADVGVSWLPLFHDMGLVGGLMVPLLHGFPLHLMAPGEFLLHPKRWLDRISRHRGTIAAAPNFAYDLLLRRVRDTAGLDLSSWRQALSGAEPVHRATLDAFAERFAPAGLRREALRPVYGLAENTLGATFASPNDPDLPWKGRPVPSVGGPLPGLQVGVRRDGDWAPDGEEGEVVVRGPTLASGYFRDPDSTAATFRQGWLYTGDLGVVQGGRLYVTGREKDLVIKNGSKFHPYDIERVVAMEVDATPNGVAAFSVPGDSGTEDLVVVVEMAGQPGDLEKRVRGKLLEELGVRADRIVHVSPGQLPRTTSGKVRRRACAERFAAAVTA